MPREAHSSMKRSVPSTLTMLSGNWRRLSDGACSDLTRDGESWFPTVCDLRLRAVLACEGLMLAAMALGQPRCEPLSNDPALLCFRGSSRVNFVERSESLLARSTNFLHSLKASCNHFFPRCRALPERQWMLSSLATSVFAAVQRGAPGCDERHCPDGWFRDGGPRRQLGGG